MTSPITFAAQKSQIRILASSEILKTLKSEMVRKKFRNSQRHIPSSESNFNEYISPQPPPQTTRNEILRLIRGGEDTFLELKVKLSNSEKIAQGIVALANTAGGTIVFGVTDQLRIEGVRNPAGVQDELSRICREDIYPSLIPYIDTIAFDDGRRIVALDVVGKSPPYRTQDGKFYLRIGAEKRETTREELSALLDESRPLFYENIPVPGVDEKDFDDALLWSFADGFEQEPRGRRLYSTASFLKKDLLLAVGIENEFVPTVAGLLLFGKNESVAAKLPQSKVIAVRYGGTDESAQVIERAEFGGNLLNLNDELNRFINRYCDLWKYRSKELTKSADDPINARGNYHLYSVREAVVNLITHRDLALRDIESQVSIFDDAIEFLNPRRTNGFVPPASKAIRFGITQRINPQISAVFCRREYGANVPQGGLPMILKQSQLFSGVRVELLTTNDRFRLKIRSA
ncbi:MAG: putative DNA binding domain-containing protein [Pyrinomonadaceae bacterium]